MRAGAAPYVVMPDGNTDQPVQHLLSAAPRLHHNPPGLRHGRPELRHLKLRGLCEPGLRARLRPPSRSVRRLRYRWLTAAASHQQRLLVRVRRFVPRCRLPRHQRDLRDVQRRLHQAGQHHRRVQRHSQRDQVPRPAGRLSRRKPRRRRRLLRRLHSLCGPAVQPDTPRTRMPPRHAGQPHTVDGGEAGEYPPAPQRRGPEHHEPEPLHRPAAGSAGVGVQSPGGTGHSELTGDPQSRRRSRHQPHLQIHRRHRHRHKQREVLADRTAALRVSRQRADRSHRPDLAHLRRHPRLHKRGPDRWGHEVLPGEFGLLELRSVPGPHTARLQGHGHRTLARQRRGRDNGPVRCRRAGLVDGPQPDGPRPDAADRAHRGTGPRLHQQQHDRNGAGGRAGRSSPRPHAGGALQLRNRRVVQLAPLPGPATTGWWPQEPGT